MVSARVVAAIAASLVIVSGARAQQVQTPATPAAGNTDTSHTFTLWPKWGPYLDLDGQVGTQRDIGAVDAFLPFWQNERSVLFGDFRFKADTQGSLEGNFGAGFRRMMDETWNAGVYGFYDHRKSPIGNLFDQLTFGAELLGKNFDFRGNTYWPVGSTVQAAGPPVTGPSTASIAGSSVVVFTPAVMQAFEYALRGFDAEAGVRVPITPQDSPYNLRFYGGGYRFDDPAGIAPLVAGPRLRLEFTDYQVPGMSGARFTVGAEWQTDNVRGSQFYAGLRVRIPLQGEPRRGLTLQERRMTDTIVRDVDIVSNTQTAQVTPAISEQAVAANGQPLTVINSATTSGANLPTAVASAGSGSVVVLSGTFSTTASTILQSGQTMMGAGSLSFRTTSGRTVNATLNGGATISATNATGVTMGSNSTLTGMTVNSTASSSGFGSIGVLVPNGASNSSIVSNTISSTTTTSNNALGISVKPSGTGGSATNVLIANNNITVVATAAGSNAIALGLDPLSGATASVKFVGNTLTATATGGTGFSSALDGGGPLTILSGSTGNTVVSGICEVSASMLTGSISYTNGTTCP